MVHAATLLTALPERTGLKAEALANYHGVPVAYMAKQLQALARAGIIRSLRGARGGYRLARPPAAISLWDIMAAVDGEAWAFRCTEIRQNGPCAVKPQDCKTPCPIAAAFHKAEAHYRDQLKAVSLADIAVRTLAGSSGDHVQNITAWVTAQATLQPD